MLVVSYDVYWAERELTVVLPDEYESQRDEIYNLLDWAYDRWIHIGEIEGEEDYLIVHDMPCEQYMVEYRLASKYDYIDWYSEYYNEED